MIEQVLPVCTQPLLRSLCLWTEALNSQPELDKEKWCQVLAFDKTSLAVLANFLSLDIRSSNREHVLLTVL